MKRKTRRRKSGTSQPQSPLTLGEVKRLLASGKASEEQKAEIREALMQVAGSIRLANEHFVKLARSVPATVSYAFRRALEPLREILKMDGRARQGDLNAICWILKWSPLDALNDEEIAVHIHERMSSKSPESKEFLEQVAEAFRKGLLHPTPGRPSKLNEEIREFAILLQARFVACPIKLKRTYRNLRSQALAIKDIAEYVSSAVPQIWREQTCKAVISVLERHPRVRAGFGVQVAARVFHLSPRSIQSTRKKP